MYVTNLQNAETDLYCHCVNKKRIINIALSSSKVNSR